MSPHARSVLAPLPQCASVGSAGAQPGCIRSPQIRHRTAATGWPPTPMPLPHPHRHTSPRPTRLPAATLPPTSTSPRTALHN
jgi:hypothetical protein